MNHDLMGVALGEEQIDGVSALRLSTLAGRNAAEGAKNRAIEKLAPVATKFNGGSPVTHISTLPTTYFTRLSSVATTSNTP